MKTPEGRWRRRGHAIVPTEPWEQGGIKNFCAESTPLGGEEWRLWYYAHPQDRSGSVLAVAEGKPGGPQRKYRVHTSAGDARHDGGEWTLSNLPDGWQPVQPVCLQISPTEHRLYFWAHAPGVVRYLCAQSPDGRHFTVLDPHRPVLHHFHDRTVAESDVPAGLTLSKGQKHERPANEDAADPALVCNDATSVYRLSDGTFELYTVALVRVKEDDPRFMPEDNAAGAFRVIDRLTSRDGIHFGGRQRVLEPDAGDPPGLQFYYLAVTHLAQRRLGLLGHYRADRQTMAIARAFSEDGKNWTRPEREPWLDHGPQGSPDSWCALAAHRLVRDAGRWWCFYTGFNYSHNFRQTDGLPRGSVLYAEWEGDDLDG